MDDFIFVVAFFFFGLLLGGFIGQQVGEIKWQDDVCSKLYQNTGRYLQCKDDYAHTKQYINLIKVVDYEQ